MPGTEQFGSNVMRRIYVKEVPGLIVDRDITDCALRVFMVFRRQFAG